MLATFLAALLLAARSFSTLSQAQGRFRHHVLSDANRNRNRGTFFFDSLSLDSSRHSPFAAGDSSDVQRAGSRAIRHMRPYRAPMAIIFGFIFRWSSFCLTVPRHQIRQVDNGRQRYAANTLGAIVGSLITGFWLVPWLGSFRVIAAAAGVNLLLAVALEFRSSQRRILPLAINVVCLLIAIAIGSSSSLYNRGLLSLSAVLYGNSFQGHLTLSEIAATNDLVFMADGVNDSMPFSAPKTMGPPHQR